MLAAASRSPPSNALTAAVNGSSSADAANSFDKGVVKTFDWKMDPLPTVVTEFFIDNIQYIKGAVPSNYCGTATGEGGAGGAGGAGGMGGAGAGP